MSAKFNGSSFDIFACLPFHAIVNFMEIAMTGHAELLKEIDKLPPQYFREVIDFVGYLR